MNEIMYDELQRRIAKSIRRKKRSAVNVIILFAAIVYLIWTSRAYILQREPIHYLEAVSMDELKNSLIEIKGNVLVDGYAESLVKRAGTSHQTSLHYIMLLEDGTVLSVAVNGNDVLSQLDQNCESFWKYLMEESDDYPEYVSLTGVLKKMNAEIEDFYQDAIEEYAIAGDDLQVVYYELDTTINPMMNFWMGIVMIVLFVANLVALVLYNKKIDRYEHRINGINQMQISSDELAS